MTNERKVWSPGSQSWIPCVWCAMHGFGRPGYELYKSVFHEHAPSIGCDHPYAEHVNFVFCSERHKQYYLNSHIEMGNLGAGYRSVL